MGISDCYHFSPAPGDWRHLAPMADQVLMADHFNVGR